MLIFKDRMADKLAVALCLTLGLLTFYPSVHFEFIHSLDDDWLITENELIRELSWSNFKALLFEDKRDCFYYPVFFLSLALDHHFFGFSPYWIKLHNLLLHLASGFFFWFLLRRLKIERTAAFIALILFVFHPIQVENFAWASCRRQVLSQFWFLLTVHVFLSYLKDEHRIRSGVYSFLMVFAYVLAIFSKFTASAALILCLAASLLFFRKRLGLKKSIPVFIVLVLISLFAFYMNMRVSVYNTIVRDFDYRWYEHPGIILQSFFQYILWVFMPNNIVLLYPPALPGGVYSGVSLVKAFGGILILGVLPICFLVFKAKRYLMAWIWFVAGVILTTDVMLVNSDLPFTVSSRHFYLGSGGLFLMIGLMFSRISCLKSFWGIGMVAACLAQAGRMQTSHWSDSVALLNHNMERAPNREAANRLALDLWQSGNKDSAIYLLRRTHHFDEALTINYPYYTRLDLAAIRKFSGDSLPAQKMIFDALLADTHQIKDTSILWQNFIKSPLQLHPPFDFRNYQLYVSWRADLFKKCGLRLKNQRI